jgi:AraC-like DNA-binding protein
VGAQTSGRWMNGVIRGTARHEVWAGLRTIPRHRHHKPYAAVIFSGGYEESGSYGRYRVKAGQVLLHRSFDAHLDRFERSGARVLNLPLDQEPVFGLGRVDDPDAIARLAATDLFAARAVLKQQLLPAHVSVDDWPDLLARDLLADPRLRLDDWAERHHLAPATLSRGFARVFATSPAAFRAEARAQIALAQLATGAALSDIAISAGFSDQPHMTRAVTALTGRPPGYWAWRVKSVQDAAEASRL